MPEPESVSDPSAQRGGTAYAPPPELAELLDSQELRTWLVEQRWYASKTLPVSAIEMVEHVDLADDPSFLVALAQARFAHGTHALYQLPLGITHPGATRTDGAPSDIHRLQSRTACRMTHSPTSTIAPERSRSGTKSAGETSPVCASCQRSSASNPTIAPVAMSTFGW